MRVDPIGEGGGKGEEGGYTSKDANQFQTGPLCKNM